MSTPKAPQVRKYMGMTLPQVSVLAALCIAILGLFCAGTVLLNLNVYNSPPRAQFSVTETRAQQPMAPELKAVIRNPFGSSRSGYPDDYVLIVLVDKRYSEADAKTLAARYDQQYADSSSFVIEFFCDAEHATEQFYKSDVPDEELYQYVLYFYMGIRGGNQAFCGDHWTSSPCFLRADQISTSGANACK